MKKNGVLNRAFIFFVIIIGVLLLFAGNLAFSETIEKSHSEEGSKKVKYLDHVHFIVKNLDEAMKTYETLLGLKPEGQGGFVTERGPQGITRIGMLPILGARIELIEPDIEVDSRFSRFLKERGEGIGGLSIFVEDFDAEVKALKDNGFAVKVQPGKLLDKYPFRLAWVEADEGHGTWIEVVDAKSVPPFEIGWDVPLRGKMTSKLDHVHFIVKDLDKAMGTYEKLLGLKPEGKGGFRRDFPGGRIGMLSIPGSRIEMLEINSKDVYQRMTRFLENHGEGIGGLSIFVEDFDAEVKALKEKGFAVEVTRSIAVDPKYPFRLGWIEAEECQGSWIELVDSKALPPYERDWDSEE